MTTISIPIQCILHPRAKCFALTVLIQTHIPASVHAGMVHIQTTQPAAVHLNMFVGTIFIQTHIPTAVQMLVHGQDTIAQPAITSTLLSNAAASQMYFAQWICVQMAAQGIPTTVAVLR